MYAQKLCQKKKNRQTNHLCFGGYNMILNNVRTSLIEGPCHACHTHCNIAERNNKYTNIDEHHCVVFWKKKIEKTKKLCTAHVQPNKDKRRSDLKIEIQNSEFRFLCFVIDCPAYNLGDFSHWPCSYSSLTFRSLVQMMILMILMVHTNSASYLASKFVRIWQHPCLIQ